MKFTRALLLASALLLSGCYTITMNLDEAGTPAGSSVGSFHSEIMVHHLIYGLVTLNNPEVRQEIANQVRAQGGRSARNVRLTHQHTFVDGLIGGITGGIYTPTHVYLDGDVVK